MILCESIRIKRSAFRHNEKSFLNYSLFTLNYSLFTLHYSSFISESFRIFPSTLSSQNEFAAPSLLPRTKRQLSESKTNTNKNQKCLRSYRLKRLLLSAQTLLNNTQILSKNHVFVKCFIKI